MVIRAREDIVRKPALAVDGVMRAIGFILGVGLTLLASCSIRFDWPEHQVMVRVMPGTSSMSLSAGDTRIDIERALMTFEEVELVACDAMGAPPNLPGFSLADLVVPPVMAHGVSTPTLFSVPVIVDMSEPSSLVAELEPPRGTYCALRLLIGPADDDAIGLDTYPRMEGKSLHIEGARRVGEDTTPLQITDTRRIELVIDLETIHGQPLKLGADSREVAFDVDLGLARWFEIAHDHGMAPDAVLETVPECVEGGMR